MNIFYSMKDRYNKLKKLKDQMNRQKQKKMSLIKQLIKLKQKMINGIKINKITKILNFKIVNRLGNK